MHITSLKLSLACLASVGGEKYKYRNLFREITQTDLTMPENVHVHDGPRCREADR